MSKTTQKWDEAREAQLLEVVGKARPVTAAAVNAAAEALEVTPRSISSKLRKMGEEVVSLAKDHVKSYSEAEEAELTKFLTSNSGKFTYAELADKVLKVKPRTAKQLQGKILSMELFSHVKATPVVERVKTYTEAEETKLLGLLKKNMFIEDIAKEMNKEVSSIRGKVLSMSRTDDTITIPKQREYKSKDAVDPIEALGDISAMTVEEIAEKIGKTPRGVKTMLTHRGLVCKNHDGAKRQEKIAEKKEVA
jgi:hypothetical protein